MPTLQGKFRDTFIPTKRLVYDAKDTGTVITLLADTEYLLQIDGLAYEYSSDPLKKLYDTSTSISKDCIPNSVINSILTLELYGHKETEIQFIIDVPAPVAEPIEIMRRYIARNNEWKHYDFNTFWYNGTESSAVQYGFRLKIKPIGANINLRNRSIKQWA
jgi:hypothetical protein